MFPNSKFETAEGMVDFILQKHDLDLELFVDHASDRLVCTDNSSVPLDMSVVGPMIEAGVLSKQVSEFGEWVLDVNTEAC